MKKRLQDYSQCCVIRGLLKLNTPNEAAMTLAHRVAASGRPETVELLPRVDENFGMEHVDQLTEGAYL
jgi:hypothetical protein